MAIPNSSPKILLVKLSSLGDVLHNLPIVWDLRARLPDAQIDWVVEEAYVDLLAPLQSKEGFRGIDRIIPFGLRRWKKNLFRLQTWKEFIAFKKDLQVISYDVMIETQGLLKSALVCALARKSRDAVVAGLANATEFSGYEPIARFFYTKAVPVAKHCHAIDRSRAVMSASLAWSALDRQANNIRFYPDSSLAQWNSTEITSCQSTFKKPYVLCFHSTARAAKRWGNEHWVALGSALSSKGYQVVFPWGNPSEKKLSALLASEIPGAIVPDAFSIQQAFSIISGAALTVGVDTGLTHLAAVLGKPTVEIYCDSPLWKTEGYWSEHIMNVGDMQASPSIDEVLAVALKLLAQ